MKHSQLRSSSCSALVTLLAFTGAFCSPSAIANSRTYTTNADFDSGTLSSGVVHTTPGQLQLSGVATPLPFMWIANGGEDTVSKINTDNGREVARYRTGFGPFGEAGHVSHLNDPWRGPAPSRTAVDASGNVYVANRHFDNKSSVVVKILATGGIERNGIPGIQTSSDINNDGVITNPSAEILPLADTNGNGYIDPNEIQDERIAWAVQVGPVNGIARSLSIGPDGNVWVGLYNSQTYYKLRSSDGAQLAGPIGVGLSASIPVYNWWGTSYQTVYHNPYGSLVDSSGILWSADLGRAFLKLNTNTNAAQAFWHEGNSYGIALGRTGLVYLALRDYGANTVAVFNPTNNSFSYINIPGSSGTLGISTDSNGDIFISASTSGVGGGYALGAMKIRPDGSVAWQKPAQAGATAGDQRGAIVDSNGDVWTINRQNNSVSKFRGNDGAALGVFPVGNQPYTYSDATGSAFLQSNPSGSWTVIQDTGCAGRANAVISWTDNLPLSGASITVEVRAADTVAGLGSVNFVAVSNGGTTPASVVGRFLEVKATLSGTLAQTLTTPILYDLTVVTPADSTPPAITCPTNITVNTAPGACSAPVTFEATATDNCVGPTTISYSPASGSVFQKGVTTVTATATDASGNTSNCTFTVTVVDKENPVISCPAPVTVNTDPGQCGAVVTLNATATDNCPGVTMSYSPASGSVFPKGTTTVTATATDASGNKSTCTFTVTVKDTELPKINCPTNIVVSTDPGLCSAVVNYPAATATDNCGPVTVTYNVPSGATFQKGTTTVTATATDGAGLKTTCTFTVTVNDTERPKITCPANIVVGTDPGLCSAVVTYSATATDNCGATVTYSIAPGSVFLKGTTSVTATATDAAGLTATCTFTVTVNDTEAPKIACPANIIVGNDPGLCSAVVSYVATATDNCGATVTYSIAPGSVFPKGTTAVTATATDAAGNKTSCTFTVTVNDTQAPAGTCVPTTNPAGGNIPGAKANGNAGQNPDGFYQLLGTDNCTAATALLLYVKDSGSNYVAGPFKSGDKVKITQAPGVTPNTKPMAGVIVAHIQLKGDALLVVTDASGNTATVATCLVAPAPK